jgi:hypothetical protein
MHAKKDFISPPPLMPPTAARGSIRSRQMQPSQVHESGRLCRRSDLQKNTRRSMEVGHQAQSPLHQRTRIHAPGAPRKHYCRSIIMNRDSTNRVSIVNKVCPEAGATPPRKQNPASPRALPLPAGFARAAPSRQSVQRLEQQSREPPRNGAKETQATSANVELVGAEVGGFMLGAGGAWLGFARLICDEIVTMGG